MGDVRRKILLVDDELNILKVVTKRLEVAGCQVAVAMDGETALMKVREAPPDLIVLDLMLPKINGYEVCTRLKQHPRYRHIPIVMFTAKTQEQDYWKGKECGADAYLTKPYSSGDLLQLVDRFAKALATSSPLETPEAPRARPLDELLD